jgi:hypothetical protein
MKNLISSHNDFILTERKKIDFELRTIENDFFDHISGNVNYNQSIDNIASKLFKSELKKLKYKIDKKHMDNFQYHFSNTEDNENALFIVFPHDQTDCVEVLSMIDYFLDKNDASYFITQCKKNLDLNSWSNGVYPGFSIYEIEDVFSSIVENSSHTNFDETVEYYYRMVFNMAFSNLIYNTKNKFETTLNFHNKIDNLFQILNKVANQRESGYGDVCRMFNNDEDELRIEYPFIINLFTKAVYVEFESFAYTAFYNGLKIIKTQKNEYKSTLYTTNYKLSKKEWNSILKTQKPMSRAEYFSMIMALQQNLLFLTKTSKARLYPQSRSLLIKTLESFTKVFKKEMESKNPNLYPWHEIKIGM